MKEEVLEQGTVELFVEVERMLLRMGLHDGQPLASHRCRPFRIREDAHDRLGHRLVIAGGSVAFPHP